MNTNNNKEMLTRTCIWQMLEFCLKADTPNGYTNTKEIIHHIKFGTIFNILKTYID